MVQSFGLRLGEKRRPPAAPARRAQLPPAALPRLRLSALPLACAQDKCKRRELAPPVVPGGQDNDTSSFKENQARAAACRCRFRCLLPLPLPLPAAACRC